MSSKAAPAKTLRQAAQDPSLLKLAQEIDQHLNAIRQRLREPLETTYASGGLTGPQRIVMHVLVTSDGLSLKQLAARVGLAHSTASGIIDRLESRGFVVRRQDEKDRRATVILPSKQVLDFMRYRMPELAINPLIETLRQASATDRATILRALRKLRTLVEQQRSSKPRA
jgi:DNA-binding MarR family transcriptional regulator